VQPDTAAHAWLVPGTQPGGGGGGAACGAELGVAARGGRAELEAEALVAGSSPSKRPTKIKRFGARQRTVALDFTASACHGLGP
jgi:hypothetical protein